MIEHEGHYWIIGAQSGKWYAHNGQNWTEAVPPAVSRIPRASAVGTAQNFDVILKKYDQLNKVTMIKLVRETRRLNGENSDLAFVKTLVESAPSVVCNRASAGDTTRLKKIWRELVRLSKSNQARNVVCAPVKIHN